MQDPPRQNVPEALRQARQAGIKVAMVTGDHPATAAAIARQIGLAPGEPVVVEGHDLPEDEAELGELLDRDGVVVSRVSPEQKLAIARALQRRGHVLAMTGDGVNDGPALSEADIGVAMGMTGTDVAREAADLVLLDDNFATIMIAVEQGRATYTNIRRFLTYHLTSNVSELVPFVVWILSGGSFPLALGVLQILALDIGTDLLPALALGGEKPSPNVLRKPPEKRHLMDGALLARVFVVLGPVQAAFAMGIFTLVLWGSGWTWGAQPSPWPAVAPPSRPGESTGSATECWWRRSSSKRCSCSSFSPWPRWPGFSGTRHHRWRLRWLLSWSFRPCWRWMVSTSSFGIAGETPGPVLAVGVRETPLR